MYQECIVNSNIIGYNFLSQTSLSIAGGVGLFVNNNLKYSKSDDLCTSKNEFEALRIDIEGPDQGIICGVLYRHPKANFENFTNYTLSLIKLQMRTNY